MIKTNGLQNKNAIKQKTMFKIGTKNIKLNYFKNLNIFDYKVIYY